jgi:hypothetical protein
MKNRILAVGVLALALLVALVPLMFVQKEVHGQGSGPTLQSRVGGNFFAPAYQDWGASIVAGNSATGSQTITICPALVTLRDGRVVNIFGQQNGTFAPISVDPQGGSAETVTPTAISTVSDPTGQFVQPCAAVTATFSFTHNPSRSLFQVISGDNGIQEAFNDAAANGGGQVYWEKDCGVITLNTGGATTTSTCNVPKTFTNLGGSWRTTTTITTAASYSLGIASATTAFINACTSLTAGQDCSQFQVSPTKVSQGAGLGALLVTANATPGAGAGHAKVWGYTEVQSNF